LAGSLSNLMAECGDHHVVDHFLAHHGKHILVRSSLSVGLVFDVELVVLVVDLLEMKLEVWVLLDFGLLEVDYVSLELLLVHFQCFCCLLVDFLDFLDFLEAYHRFGHLH